MKNKVNILEELNKMKNLIYAKRGTVISEQATPEDIDKVKKGLDSISLSGQNEKDIVDVITKYKTKEQFEDFLYQFQQKTGGDFAKRIGRTINPERDQAEWNTLVNHLAKMGINLNYDYMWGTVTMTGATPKALSAGATESTARQKNINFNYCSVKNGKIENAKSSDNGTTWSNYVSTYKITAEEIAAAKATCPSVIVPDVIARQKSIRAYVCSVKDGKIENPNLALNGTTWESYVTKFEVTAAEIAAAKASACPGVVLPDVVVSDGDTPYKFGDDLSKALEIKNRDNTQKGNTNDVNTRFTKSATDLGVQSDKMDLQTLQSILAKLQDDGSQPTVTQDINTTTSGTPDLTQLSTLLNQLQS